MFRITSANIPNVVADSQSHDPRLFDPAKDFFPLQGPVEEFFESEMQMMLRFAKMISQGNWSVTEGPGTEMVQAIKKDGSILIQAWKE